MLISVVVPVYKVEKYLNRCIDSILSQTFTDFELILVNDGSPDNCGEICDEYAKKDRRITVIHKENGGLSDARNAGIDWAFKNSNSEWITFIDSDDWIDRRYLEILFNTAVENHVDVSVCDFLRTSNFEDTDTQENFTYQKWDVTDFFVEKNLNFVVAWGKLYKKSLFEKIRYPKGKLHEDELTTYKVLFCCEGVVFIESKLYNYFINNEGIMQGKMEDIWDANKVNFLEAMEERTKYFKERKLCSALKFQKEEYLYFTYIYCKFVHRSTDDEEKQKYIHYLRKKLRKAIRQNIGYMSNFSQFHRDVYEIAYPTLSGVYWNTFGKFKIRKQKKSNEGFYAKDNGNDSII